MNIIYKILCEVSKNKKCFFFIVFLASFETWKLKSKKHFHVFMFLWLISVLCCFFQTHTHKYIHTNAQTHKIPTLTDLETNAVTRVELSCSTEDKVLKGSRDKLKRVCILHLLIDLSLCRT